MIVEHRFPVAIAPEDFVEESAGLLESLDFVVAMPCGKCGYDLRGSVAGSSACPECGTSLVHAFHHDPSLARQAIVLLATHGKKVHAIKVRVEWANGVCGLACTMPGLESRKIKGHHTASMLAIATALENRLAHGQDAQSAASAWREALPALEKSRKNHVALILAVILACVAVGVLIAVFMRI